MKFHCLMAGIAGGLLLAGCSDTNGAPIAGVTSIAVGSDCGASAGMRVASGYDTNDNGILDVEEETSAVKFCYNNRSQPSTLVTFTTFGPDAASEACAETGGVKVTSAVDTDGDSQLSAEEIAATGSHGYLCNGSAGGQVSMTPIDPSDATSRCAGGPGIRVVYSEVAPALDICVSDFECALPNLRAEFVNESSNFYSNNAYELRLVPVDPSVQFDIADYTVQAIGTGFQFVSSNGVYTVTPRATGTLNFQLLVSNACGTAIVPAEMVVPY